MTPLELLPPAVPMILPFRAATAIETGEVGIDVGGDIVLELGLVVPATDEDGVVAAPEFVFPGTLIMVSRLMVASFNGVDSNMSAFSSTMTLRAVTLICFVLIKFKTFPGVPITTCAAMTGNGSALDPTPLAPW